MSIDPVIATILAVVLAVAIVYPLLHRDDS
jgi:hypothetical protein